MYLKVETLLFCFYYLMLSVTKLWNAYTGVRFPISNKSFLVFNLTCIPHTAFYFYPLISVSSSTEAIKHILSCLLHIDSAPPAYLLSFGLVASKVWIFPRSVLFILGLCSDTLFPLKQRNENRYSGAQAHLQN